MCKDRNGRGPGQKLGAHAAAVVDNKTDAYRIISVQKQGNVLWASVFVYAEVLKRKPSDNTSACICNAHGQPNQLRLHRNSRLGRLIRCERSRLQMIRKRSNEQDCGDQRKSSKSTDLLRASAPSNHNNLLTPEGEYHLPRGALEFVTF